MNPIIVKFRAFDLKSENGVSSQFDRQYTINSADELAAAVVEFEGECPFRKFEMETDASHENETPLTAEEREWFLAEDKKSDIGFL